jgi:hypothetical protein
VEARLGGVGARLTRHRKGRRLGLAEGGEVPVTLWELLRASWSRAGSPSERPASVLRTVGVDGQIVGQDFLAPSSQEQAVSVVEESAPHT